MTKKRARITGNVYLNGQIENTTLLPSIGKDNPHLQTLLEHKHIYDLFMQCGELVGFHPHIQNEVVAAYMSEHPHYHYDAGCGACVAEMLCTVYKWYETKVI
jgi:hypothetical protein